MPIKFRCKHCNKKLAAPRRKAGLHSECPKCGQPILIPLTQKNANSPKTATLNSDLDPPAIRKPRKTEQDAPPIIDAELVPEVTRENATVVPQSIQTAGNASIFFMALIFCLCCGCPMMMVNSRGGRSNGDALDDYIQQTLTRQQREENRQLNELRKRGYDVKHMPR